MEGLDAPRERPDATELVEGRRRRVGVVGAACVSVCECGCCVVRMCASSRRAAGCPEGLRECEAGIALDPECYKTLQGRPSLSDLQRTQGQHCPPVPLFHVTAATWPAVLRLQHQ